MKVRKLSLKGLMVAVFITFFAVGAVHGQVPGVVPNLSIWADTWFKVTLSEAVYHFSNIGVKPTPGYPIPQAVGTAYVKITGWNTTTPGAEFLTVDVYSKDRDTGQWVPIPAQTLNILYFAGSDVKFIGTAGLAPINGVTMNLVFVFTGRRNKANTNFIMDGTTKLGTIGSSILEEDDISTERWAGSVKIGGPMVPVSQLPPALRGL